MRVGGSWRLSAWRPGFWGTSFMAPGRVATGQGGSPGLRMESWAGVPACIFGISVDAKGVGQPVGSAVMLAFRPDAPGAAPRSGVARKRHRWPHCHPLPLEGTSAPPQRPRRHLQHEVPRPQQPKVSLPCCLVGDANMALSTVPQRTQALQAQASSPEQGRG